MNCIAGALVSPEEDLGTDSVRLKVYWAYIQSGVAQTNLLTREHYLKFLNL